MERPFIMSRLSLSVLDQEGALGFKRSTARAPEVQTLLEVLREICVTATMNHCGEFIPVTSPLSEAFMSDSETPETPPETEFTREELKLALKAFHKRLRLTKLDDESQLGRGAMTSGKNSGVCAISPPGQFPAAIWQALVEKGKLKYAGHGLYESLVFQG